MSPLVVVVVVVCTRHRISFSDCLMRVLCSVDLSSYLNCLNCMIWLVYWTVFHSCVIHVAVLCQVKKARKILAKATMMGKPYYTCNIYCISNFLLVLLGVSSVLMLSAFVRLFLISLPHFYWFLGHFCCSLLDPSSACIYALELLVVRKLTCVLSLVLSFCFCPSGVALTTVWLIAIISSVHVQWRFQGRDRSGKEEVPSVFLFDLLANLTPATYICSPLSQCCSIFAMRSVRSCSFQGTVLATFLAVFRSISTLFHELLCQCLQEKAQSQSAWRDAGWRRGRGIALQNR